MDLLGGQIIQRNDALDMTKYYDETEEPTLPINLGTHSIYFYAE
jgi:hypothetical protein